MKLIASIEEDEVATFRHADAFVECVVKTFVALADNDNLQVGILLLIGFRHLHSAICRTTIHDDVFHVAKLLLCHALQRSSQRVRCIVCSCDNAELHHGKTLSLRSKD